MGRNDLPNVLAARQTAGTRDRTDSPHPSSLRGTSLHQSAELGCGRIRGASDIRFDDVEDLGFRDEAAFDDLGEPREDLVRQLDDEFDQEVLAEATARVRARVEPKTWRVFELTAYEGRSGAEVAETLGMTVAAVFVWVNWLRVMARPTLLKDSFGLLTPKLEVTLPGSVTQSVPSAESVSPIRISPNLSLKSA